MPIDTHDLDLTRTVTSDEETHMSIDMLNVEMTRITSRQFKYYKPLNNLSE